MTTTIYKFEQGRLLVHEERAVETHYRGSGVPVRIGGVRTIDEVLSITTDYERYGLVTPLAEVRTSGSEIFVVMRRGELGNLGSGLTVSGLASLGLMSGITSGLAWMGELVSGGQSGLFSGHVTVTANVIGY